MNLLNKIIQFARVSGKANSGDQFPVQQLEYKGKVADGLIIFPYGVYGNVPTDALAVMFAVEGHLENRSAIAYTPKNRPDLEQGEVAFYHPPTDAFIIWKNNGDLDIETGNSGSGNIKINSAEANITTSGNVNIDCDTANIKAASSVDIDSPSTNLGVGGKKIALDGDPTTDGATIIATGTNTSI